MTNQDILDLHAAFERVGSVPANPRWSFWCAYNKRKIKLIADSIQEAIKPPEQAIDYERQRIRIAKRYSETDPATGVGRLRDRAGYEAEVTVLKEGFPDIAKDIEAHLKTQTEFLRQPATAIPDLSRVSFSDLPDGLPGNAVELLIDWIDAPAPSTKTG